MRGFIQIRRVVSAMPALLAGNKTLKHDYNAEFNEVTSEVSMILIIFYDIDVIIEGGW